MRILEPEFPDSFALFIIWHEEPGQRKYSLAAGTLAAMEAAWEVVADKYPHAELTLQERARVLRKRDPIKRGA